MKNIEFNTQICTTIEQSKRLLELGLDVETSDMCWLAKKLWGDDVAIPEGDRSYILSTDKDDSFCSRYDVDCIPAWSLHRLIAMLPDRKMTWLAAYCDSEDYSKIYNEAISLIEWMIENELLCKEYLKEESTHNPRVKEFQWCGLRWVTAMENNRPISPGKPWYYFDGSQVLLDMSAVIHLSICRYPRTINWFDSKWEKKLDYHPTMACGVIRSVDTVPVNSVIECEVKMPKGNNLWPSFWLTACDVWPPEIDVFEGYTNSKGSYKDGIGLHRTFPFIYREIRMESNVHYKGAKGEHLWAGAKALNKKFLKMPLEDNWNHFLCEWRDDSIRFYVNGKLVRSVTDAFLLSQMKTEGMWVIFNVWPNDRFNMEEDGDITAFKQCYSIRNFKVTQIK